MKQNKEIKLKIRKLINDYLKKEKKTTIRITQEWKKEEQENKKRKLRIIHPRIYSNEYFAFIELKNFWEEIKLVLK